MYRKATIQDKKSQSEIKVGLCVASEKLLDTVAELFH